MSRSMNLRFISVLTLTIIASSSALAVTPADYAGTWSFNREKSKDLPEQITAVKGFDLTVTVDKSLKVDVDIETGQAEMPHMRRSLVYPLDGSESATTTEVRTPAGPKQIPTRLSGKVEENGALDLTLSRDLQMGGNLRTLKSVEKWELSADGKSLTVRVNEERPNGPAIYAMVFERKK